MKKNILAISLVIGCAGFIYASENSGNKGPYKQSEINFDDEGNVTDFFVSKYDKLGNQKSSEEIKQEISYCLGKIAEKNGFQSNEKRFLNDAKFYNQKQNESFFPFSIASPFSIPKDPIDPIDADINQLQILSPFSLKAETYFAGEADGK